MTGVLQSEEQYQVAVIGSLAISLNFMDFGRSIHMAPTISHVGESRVVRAVFFSWKKTNNDSNASFLKAKTWNKNSLGHVRTFSCLYLY